MAQKIAVVTGASSGMGARMAQLLCSRIRQLDQILLIARREDRLLSLKEQLEASSRGKKLQVRILPGDLMSRDFLVEIEGLLSEERPEILFLVNGAGFGKLGKVADLDRRVQEDMLRLNCGVLFSLTKICLPYMKDRAGRIINFASAAAFLPQPEFAVYAAGKSFVLSFSRALNQELKDRRISVTAVCPGPVRTEFFDIAEEHGAVPLYKKMVMADAGAVTKKAFSDSLRRRPVSVYGGAMKGLRIAARLLPEGLFLTAIDLINHRPGKGPGGRGHAGA